MHAKIFFALCGNSYTEELARTFTNGKGILFSHRSNAKTLTNKLKQISVFFIAITSSQICKLFKKYEFTLILPHNAGNYGRLLKILAPKSLIIIDDGITFEYWSEFHVKHIAPLLNSQYTTELLGPHMPNWPLDWDKKIKQNYVSRREITRNIIRSHHNSNDHANSEITPSLTGYIIDDGNFTNSEISKIKQAIINKKGCKKVITIWHPARNIKNSCSGKRLPAEVLILNSKNQIPTFVLGRASTALFNIIEYNNNISVASFKSNLVDLDRAASDLGMTIITSTNYDDL